MTDSPAATGTADIRAISIIGCAQGLTARNGAAGVGLTTRAAVRDAFIVVIILNFLMGKVIWH